MSRRSSLLLACLLLLTAANSVAMSLGRLRGAALIGRPLDLSIQAVMDAKDDITGLCIDADVFYADNKIDKSRVRVTAEKGANGTMDAVIRVRASALVDEPVVTVYLRAGCQQKIERRYVALADLVSDVVPDRNSAALGAQQLQLSPYAGAGQSSAELGEPVAPRVPRAARDKAPLRASNQAMDGTARKSPRPVAAPTGDRPAAKPLNQVLNSSLSKAPIKPNAPEGARLKLESLDLTGERSPQLKQSTELVSAPTTNLQERAVAAALWRAIASEPEDRARELDKLQVLEGSVRTLQAQDQKSRQSITDLDSQLKKATQDQYANVLVYALVALLLLALAGLAYLLRERVGRSQADGVDAPWWRKGDAGRDSGAPWARGATQAVLSEKSRSPIVKKSLFNVSRQTARLVPEVDLSSAQAGIAKSGENTDIDLDSLRPADSKYPSDFTHSMAPSRAIKAEELFDVQQQADFFVSIGQHSQAIDVLRAHIAENVDTSALIYLDLFDLYHHLQRKDDYALLRDDFNRRFNTEVPAFDLYTDAGPGLEAYPTAIATIVALWRSPKILELIEESIFRRPETKADAFNLEAYRELLLLYSVAKDISGGELKVAGVAKRSDPPVTSVDDLPLQQAVFLPTELQPLSTLIDQKHAMRATLPAAPIKELAVPYKPDNSALDLDLSEPPLAARKPSVASASLNVADAAFFAQFDKLSASLPIAAPAGSDAPVEKSDTVVGNLLDFEAFSADTKPSGGQQFKLPKL